MTSADPSQSASRAAGNGDGEDAWLDTVTYDVIVIGYGPVGQTCAALLGRAGHRVAVVERFPGLYGLARAGHVDHEIMRIFQSVGAADAVERDGFVADQYVFQNAAGDVLMSFEYGADGVSGWGNDYIVYQPSVEDALDNVVRGCDSVDVFQGCEAVSVHQDDAGVAVATVIVETDSAGVLRRLDDTTRTLRSKYVVAADGANSRVRSSLGIAWQDLGFASTWLVIDLVPTGSMHFEYDNAQICDPARPHCLFQLGKHHRRFEFAAVPGDDLHSLTRADTAWELMARYDVTPDNARIERQAVYTFGSGVAERVRDRRVFLVGDAAHLMPPFLGQGMCTGIRDAMSLAWRMDAVLSGTASTDLFDSFDTERLSYAEELVRMSITAGEISCTFDPELAAARDRAMLAGDAPPPPELPALGCGLVANGDALAGHLAPQGRVTRNGVAGRFDDLVGVGWTVLSLEPATILHPEVAAGLESAGVTFVHMEPGLDSSGTYRDFFRAHGITALIYRPDFRIWGSASDRAILQTRITQLLDTLSALALQRHPLAVAAPPVPR